MMHGRQKSDLGVVAQKLANKLGRPGAESVEPKARGQGEHGQVTHAPDSGPGWRVPAT